MATNRHIVLTRYLTTNDAVFSDLHVYGDQGHLYFTKAMELPYRDNRRMESSIPPGTYVIRKEYSPRFNMQLWELYGVPNRSEIKIHVANFVRQLNGCIALGKRISDINNDGNLDLASSRRALDAFHKAMDPARHAFITINQLF